MSPDFSKKTIDTLAKRAAYLCSNPDCRVSTVGPNTMSDIATVIGEAAHIHAARAEQARFDEQMTDQARSQISNAIWLCGNCHTQVDRDPVRFPADLLFMWREKHDEYVAANLGSQTHKARFELTRHALAQFENYPPIIRRIAYDKSPGWEWSLTAALMRHLNAPSFRRLEDIREGIYIAQIEPLDDSEVLSWVSGRLDEMGEMIGPLSKIIERFNRAWGAHGEPGDVDQIHHTALLLRESLAQIVKHEERLKSVRVSSPFERTIELLQDALGSQIDKLRMIPDRLNALVELALSGEHEGTKDNPLIVHETIEFTLPENWSDELNREIKRASRSLNRNVGDTDSSAPSPSIGCITWMSVLFLIVVFLIFS